jgi:hypothetical protein
LAVTAVRRNRRRNSRHIAGESVAARYLCSRNESHKAADVSNAIIDGVSDEVRDSIGGTLTSGIENVGNVLAGSNDGPGTAPVHRNRSRDLRHIVGKGVAAGYLGLRNGIGKGAEAVNAITDGGLDEARDSIGGILTSGIEDVGNVLAGGSDVRGTAPARRNRRRDSRHIVGKGVAAGYLGLRNGIGKGAEVVNVIIEGAFDEAPDIIGGSLTILTSGIEDIHNVFAGSADVRWTAAARGNVTRYVEDVIHNAHSAAGCCKGGVSDGLGHRLTLIVENVDNLVGDGLHVRDGATR